MAVDGQGDAGVGVAQAVGYVDGQEACIYQQAGVGMAQVVEADPLYSGLLGILPHGMAQHIPGIGKYAPGGLSLQLLEIPEHLCQESGHDDHPLAGFGLAAADDIPFVQPDKGLVDGYGVFVKIYILPGQGQQLTLPHPCPEKQVKGHDMVRPGQDGGKFPKLLQGPVIYLPLLAARRLTAGAGILRQTVMLHGKGKDAFHQAADLPDIHGGQLPLHQSALPGLYLRPADLANRQMAKAGQDVVVDEPALRIVGDLSGGLPMVFLVGLHQRGKGDVRAAGIEFQELPLPDQSLMPSLEALLLFLPPLPLPVRKVK